MFDVEHAAYQFELVLNLKTARIPSVALSPLWLAGADEVIEWENDVAIWLPAWRQALAGRDFI